MRGRVLLPVVLAVLALDTPVPAAAGTSSCAAATAVCAWSWRTVSVRKLGTACVPGPRQCVRGVVATTVVFDVATFGPQEGAERRR